MNENVNDESHEEQNNTLENISSITTSSSAAKEKRSWFHSLTRRKKSQSETSLVGATPRTTSAEPLSQNNNNDPLPLDGVVSSTGLSNSEDSACASTSRKRKDEKNVFQRIRKKMELRFNSLRQRRHASADDDDVRGGAGGTTDASSEFLTHSPIREPQLTFSFNHSYELEEPELGLFTRDYQRFVVKKWLQGEGGPNHVMFRACCEMLSQVWYWGEISRSDAQKQLTDKPTGSFLVRDSETSGCKYTLSFRIHNVTLHYRLEYHQNYWHFEELQYDSIVKMIDDIIFRCANDKFVCFVKVPNEMQPSIPVILRYPLSRYSKMPLLQDLCRRVIQRHHTTSKAILKLPVPPKLLEYLSEKRELVFQC